MNTCCNHELIASVKEQMLTPTEIGKELGKSGQEINKILTQNGFQRRLSNGKYEPLELGMPHAVMLDVNKAHTYWTTPQLKGR